MVLRVCVAGARGGGGMDDEHVSSLSLKAAARAQRKSVGKLTDLVTTSVALVWRSGRGLFVLLLVLQLTAALALAGQVLAVQAVLSAVLSGAGTGTIVRPVLLLAGLSALSLIATGAQGQVQRLLGERVTRAMWRRVLTVATRVALRHFESPEFYNRLSRVQTNALTRPYQVTQGLLGMAGGLTASIAVAAALASVSPVLLPLVVIGGVPVLLTNRRESRLEFDFALGQTVTVRWREYFTVLQTGRDEAKEVRAFGLAAWLLERFERHYDAYLRDLVGHVRRRTALTVLGQIGSALVLVATLLVLVWLIATGRIGVAGAGAAIVAIRMLAAQVQSLFKGMQVVFESGLFLDDLDRFLELGTAAAEEDDGEEAPESFRRIVAEDLHFRYPAAESEALRGVSVELGAGELVALVGENGSGKTTLAKLLAGLYEPDGGAVRWDGRDVSAFRPSSLRQRVSVVFQDFVRYAFSAEENIAIGRADAPTDPDRVRAAARAAGAEQTIQGLPEGYEQLLSRLFPGGRELSGGQWQRIALARSFYRDAPLVILDEPSASLDPRAEHALFSSLRAALRGRTALFISHRFSTVRGADRIYVLHDGQVVESGSHDDLMALDGRYAELYRLQAGAFLEADRDPDA